MSAFRKIPDFEEIPHKADAALIVYGLDLPELFIHAAQGMYHIMGIIGKDHPKTPDTIALQAFDNESLLVSFLSELYFLAEKNLKTEVIELRIEDNYLNARIFKTPVTSIAKEIKAVTFNEMKIFKQDDTYQTKIVFDL
ncbi:MAG: archease [Pelolinea sp.]|nr:archease [Pelolinea sp.]